MRNSKNLSLTKISVAAISLYILILVLISYKNTAPTAAEDISKTSTEVALNKTDVNEKAQNTAAPTAMDKAISYISNLKTNTPERTLLLESIEAVLDLDQKVLQTNYERSQYQSALSDLAFLQAAADLVKDDSNLTAANLESHQSERMKAVLLLSRSIEWSENNRLNGAKQIISQLVLDDNLAEVKDLKIRKSLAADKLELFTVLKSVDKAKGLEIERLNKSQLNARIIRFANNYYELNKTKEL